MEPPKSSDCDTIEYWKKQAKHYEQKVIDIQQELDEYTENSAQLEKELEASIVQVEKQNRGLEHQNQRLKNEIEMLRNKLERSQQETNALESELQALKIEKDKQAVYVRELEQKNDDLERGQRVISESVSCIETLLNQAYERNAVLESEVDEVENLRVKLQRATDEARDLKQELKVMERVPKQKREEGDTALEHALLNGHVPTAPRPQLEIETHTTLMSPQKREINGNAMSPSSRAAAINIVGDLLRKVGLERFLCRECGKVKCSCDTPAAANHRSMTPPRDADNKAEEIVTTATVEYRNTNGCARPPAEPDRPPADSPPALTHRASDQPFVRPAHKDTGNLRRSFAVRSREGLENLLNFTTRKGHDQVKVKPVQK